LKQLRNDKFSRDISALHTLTYAYGKHHGLIYKDGKENGYFLLRYFVNSMEGRFSQKQLPATRSSRKIIHLYEETDLLG
jgi:hypothetical protein